MPRDVRDVSSSSSKGGRRKAPTPYLAESPDETISIAAFHKLKEELEDMKANAPPVTDIDPLTMRPVGRAGRAQAEQQESIFEEYSRELAAQRQHKVSNKQRVPADVDLRKHQRNLCSSTRYDKLRFSVKQRCDPDWEADVADLVQKHGGWHRVKTAQEKRRIVKMAGNDSPVLGKPTHKQQSPLARQLRELHKHFADPNKDKNALGIQIKGKLKERHMGGEEDSNSPRSRAVLTFLDFMLTRFGGLREAFKAIDHNRNGRVTRVEFNQVCGLLEFHPQVGDADQVFRLLDLNHDGEISIREFHSLKPYLDQLLSMCEEDSLKVSTSCSRRVRPDSTGACPTSAPGSRAGDATDGSPSARGRRGSEHIGSGGHMDWVEQRKRDSSVVSQTSTQRPSIILAEKAPNLHKLYALRQKEKERNRKSCGGTEEIKSLQEHNRLPEIEIPRTCSLTLFRNADKAHAGAALFLRQTPSSLENLYGHCEKECRPVAGTVQILLDQDMRPLRSIEDLRNGSVYLVKGAEALAPPIQFWQCKPAEHRPTCSPIGSRRGSVEEHAPDVAQEVERRESDGAADLLRKVTEDAIEELNTIGDYEGNSTRLPEALLPAVAKPIEHLAAKTCPAGWFPQGATSPPCRQRAMVYPKSRGRDREWNAYEPALGTFWPSLSVHGSPTSNRSGLHDWQSDKERAVASREHVAALQRSMPDGFDGFQVAGSAARPRMPSLTSSHSSPDLFFMSLVKRGRSTPDKAWSTQSSWNSPQLHQSTSLPKI